MKKLYVIKIGGNIIDNEVKLAAFIRDFAAVEGLKILVHGGGKLATKLAADLGIEQQMIDYNAENGTEGKVFAGAITFAGGIEFFDFL